MILKLCFLVIWRFLGIKAQDTNNVCSSLEAYVQNMSTNPNCWHDPDVNSTPEERALNNGFLLEKYRVKTDDGYILALFRLKSLKGFYGKDVVFLQHGMSTDAICFMCNKENSIAFFLAKNGFDVWLGNFRGSEYCDHERLSADDPKYWDFSFHEHGLYDLPAMFRYIASKTKRKITYIGHSMGGTAMVVYASMRPNATERYIKQAILIAPAIYMKHILGTMESDLLVNNLYPLFRFLPLLNLNVLFEVNSFERVAFQQFCHSSLKNVKLCLRIIEYLEGDSAYPFEPQKLPAIFDMIKNTGLKIVVHYVQSIMTGSFGMFDYGAEENMLRYNSKVSPNYNLTDMTIPLSWIYGSADNTATKEDILYAFNTYRKPNWDKYELPYNHVDFLLLEDVKETLLPLLLKIINKNNK